MNTKDIAKLMNSSQRLANAIVVQTVLGLSDHEMCRIRRTYVDPDELTIKIRAHGELYFERIEKLPVEYERNLLFYYWYSKVKNSNFLICNDDGTKMSPDQYKTEVKKVLAISRIKNTPTRILSPAILMPRL